MARKISLITAIAGAVLVLAVPAAWGDSWGADRQQQVDFWNYDQQGKQIANSSPGVAPDRLAKLYSGVTTESSAPIGSPDLADRAAAATQARLSNTLDARERALSAGVGSGKVSALEARERSFEVKRAQPTVVQSQGTRTPVVDDRFRIAHVNAQAPAATSSGRDLEWPQIGLGFGIGIALMLGLYLAMRTMRQRPLAH